MAALATKPNTSPTDAQIKTGLPYERVLLATGDTVAAMSLLQAKTDIQSATTPPYSRKAMLWGLGRILERSDAATLISDWPDEKLYALLRQQGIIEEGTKCKNVLSLIVQEDRVTFELWQNGQVIGGCFKTPTEAWFKSKAIKKLTGKSITVTSDTITTPIFTITLGDTPGIEFQANVFPPGKVADGMQQPFTHRFVLFAP